MKATVFTVSAVLAVSPLFGSCEDMMMGEAGNEETVTVMITTSEWNGWDPTNVPTPTSRTEELAVGESMTASGEINDRFSITVTSIDEDSATFDLGVELARQTPSGGFDYQDLVSEFTVTADESTFLATPTMDSGKTYEVTVDLP